MTTPTPILAAVYRGDRARAEPALAGRSPDGWPALHLAAHFGHGDAVDALVEACADVRARSDNDEANTALHAGLAGRGDLRIVSRLLAGGAAADARADDGRTALTIAEERGHAHVARRLRGELP